MEDPRSPCPRAPNPPAPPPDPERLLRKSTAWGRGPRHGERKLAPATCHCPVLVLPLPFPSSSCRADDGGPALFAPPAPLLLPAACSPTTAQRLEEDLVQRNGVQEQWECAGAAVSRSWASTRRSTSPSILQARRLQ